MSRAEVRDAVVSYLRDAAIPNLNKIHTTFPKLAQLQENATAGQLFRAAAVVYIMSESESRIAVGGASSGWKRIDYDVDVQLFTEGFYPKAEDTMADFDALVDAIKDRLRSGDHRLGKTDGSVIWEAAEGTGSVSVSYGEPTMNDFGTVNGWVSIVFRVTQMIQA